MALRLSTGLRNKMLGLQATPKAIATNGLLAGTLAYADGGLGEDSITTTAGSFITAGFAPGDKIYTYGSTTAGNDLEGVVLAGVTADTLTFATDTVDTAQDFAAGTVLVCCKGGALRDVFQHGVLKIYSGSQPAGADSAATGTLLLTVSVSSGAFAHGAFTNGLTFGDAASGAIDKAAGETWSGAAVASGTAGWFRFVANPTDSAAASTDLPRIDGNIGTSGADLNMSSTTITAGRTYTIDDFTLTLPAYYGA